MAEDLQIIEGNRADKYQALIPQVEALIQGETDLYANLANIAAAIHAYFGFFWVGFYLNKQDQLVLGPFQGPVACTRIPYHKGVCGHAYRTQESIIVPNVDEFPGHIACASASKSEIVLPVMDSAGEVVMVLDVDSDQLDDFSETDREGLQAIIDLIEKNYSSWY
ncbi:GAF domain-containing protein [Aquirufa ecclesiirivi]|uniref:GAF domain-containing protein n=1 Tax=Aquirufa ecclesiirivi TaxID=2715124 RepID=A0ABT4JIX3_9BACT|nr:GAF domain-containing protein [Aquirufa ecclesiirivi]MCZ2476221.1 GAF domain-containing protein [Aquirufa ecclesiirivi]MDF0693475.1 GAF domain-containing protein [Aquirufa ecclesiirivi]